MMELSPNAITLPITASWDASLHSMSTPVRGSAVRSNSTMDSLTPVMPADAAPPLLNDTDAAEGCSHT